MPATTRNPQHVLREAKIIARDHGLFVQHRGFDYILYRDVDSGHPTFLGKYKTPDSLLRKVCKVTGFR